MDAGKITDTILFWSEHAVTGLSTFVFINVMFVLELILSFFVPSSSGLAVLTMPIMAPLADFAGVGRHLVVTAYQSANGLVNLVNPTFAVVMGGLTIGRVPLQPVAAVRVAAVSHSRRHDHGRDQRGGMSSVAPAACRRLSEERTMNAFGVHSEVGTLRTVMVCRPGLAHQRLTPGNRADLLFDDVLWVHEAQKDHYDFVLKMQERGVEVLDLHDLLAETLADPQARAWVLDRRITANDVGLGIAPVLARLARRDAGGDAGRTPDRRHRHSRHAEERADVDARRGLRRRPTSSSRRCRTRCFSATRPAGSTTASPCNPMYWPARKPETLLQRAVYKFHPRFADGGFTIWWGDSDGSITARRRSKAAM